MARTEVLQGWNVGARKIQMPVQGDNGDPGLEERWELGFIEVGSGNRIVFVMDKNTRDVLVRQLTSGIVLAGGDLPQL